MRTLRRDVPRARRPRKLPGRYEIRSWASAPRARPGEVRVKTGTIWTSDAHYAAVELYRLQAQQRAAGASNWRYEVVDHGPNQDRKLGEIVTYDELVRRAGSLRDARRVRRDLRPARRRPRARYEIRSRSEGGARSEGIWTDDPHYAAVEVYRLSALKRGPARPRYEVIDHGPQGHGLVIPYKELVKRAGSFVASRDRLRRARAAGRRSR